MQRLARVFSRSSNTTSSVTTPNDQPNASTSASAYTYLPELPTELLLSICSYLPYENAISFSLTCKSMYELIFHTHKPTPKHHGHETQFLRLLERDFPGYLSCPIHERLYAWKPQKQKRYQCPLCTSSKRSAFIGSVVICNRSCRSSFYGIYEPERRLILRHALLGAEYGITHRLLDHVCKRSLSKRANEVTPKIVNGVLMLWRTIHITLRTDPKSWKQVDATITDFNAAICLHTEEHLPVLLQGAASHARKYCTNYLDEKGVKKRTFEGAEWSCPITFMCSMCATDIRLHMDQSNANEVTVRFDVYQDLGGLQELSIAQRQVFGVRHGPRHTHLTDSASTVRLQEDLESMYHHGAMLEPPNKTLTMAMEDLGEGKVSKEGISAVPPAVSNQVVPFEAPEAPGLKQRCFIDQWSQYKDAEGTIRLQYYRQPMVQYDIYKQYRTVLPFQKVRLNK